MNSNLIPIQFTSSPTLTPEKAVTIKQWYDYVLKASNNRNDLEEVAYFTGATHMADSVLRLIHDNVPAEKVVEVVKVVKKNKIFGVRKIYIYAAVIWIVVDGRLVKKAKVKFSQMFPDEPIKPVDNSKK